jgi:hypothetical protein
VADPHDSRTVLGDWVLGELIGTGTGTAVHRGHHRLHPDRAVAIKRLVGDRATAVGPATVAALRDEAATLADVSHPAVIPCTDVVVDGNGVALVMPLAPGGSLGTRIHTGGALPWCEVAELGARVASALAAAHGMGIVHRDVAPGNILFGHDLEPRLADFGSALLAGGDDDRVVGTPGYLDPLVARGLPASAASDVYGLGVVLYEALAGQPPFAGVTPDAVQRAADRGVHLPLADLVPGAPLALTAAIERAMARDSADRFAGARELQVALEHVVLTEVPTATDPDVDRAVSAGLAVTPGADGIADIGGGADADGGGGAGAGVDAAGGTEAVADSDDIGLAATTDFGPRPIAMLDVEQPRRPWWVVVALVVVVVVPVATAAWAVVATRSDTRSSVVGNVATTVATPSAPVTSGTATNPTATPLGGAPRATTTPAAGGAALVPRVPAPCRGQPPTVDDQLLGDVDGRGCALAITVVRGDEFTTLTLPDEAGELAGDYLLEGPPVHVVVGDWDGDGVDTPAVTLDDSGVVFAFGEWGAGRSTAIGTPIGATPPVVVTGPDGRDRVVGDDAG